MRNYLLLTVCIAVLFTSCSKSSSTSTTLSETAIIFTVMDAENNVKSGYTIMMFTEKFQLDELFPTIEKQVVSDSEGIAKFDLNDYIVNPKTLYFEAFVKEGNGYVWKSIVHHPEITISKGTKTTTSIIVE